jgi:hypothetical protein
MGIILGTAQWNVSCSGGCKHGGTGSGNPAEAVVAAADMGTVEFVDGEVPGEALEVAGMDGEGTGAGAAA